MSKDNPIRILFFCYRNDSRSQMAEGFARALRLPGVEFHSAGLESTDINPVAVRVMGEIGIDISHARSKKIADLRPLKFDVVFSLCDEASDKLEVLPGQPMHVRWHLDDPSAILGDDELVLRNFRHMRDVIQRLVTDLRDRGYLDAFAEARQHEILLLDNISDGIIAHDMQRRIFHFNRAAEVITGYKREDVLNRDCHRVFPGKFCGEQCRFDDGEPRMEPHTRQVEIVNRQGERRLLKVVSQPLQRVSGEPEGVMVLFHDITNERRLSRRVGEIEEFSGIIGRDEKMLEVFDLISEVADSNVPVLIQGESGTGKELVAAALHSESPRANRLFVPVNCGALSETLLESELFGHVKGAFTGAIRDKKGRFELADGGTIFLDEIGDISPAMQVRLLRVVQEGTFEPVGSESTIKVNVRVISATNKDLHAEMAAGRFREDLFYRLNVFPLQLPPLRERRNDIPLLTHHILERIVGDGDRQVPQISSQAMDVLLSYEWPGNVRELQNWMQYAMVKCGGDTILSEHLPPTRNQRPVHATASVRRRKLTVKRVLAALREASGSKVEAARVLGVSRATLYRFLNDVGMLQ